MATTLIDAGNYSVTGTTLTLRHSLQNATGCTITRKGICYREAPNNDTGFYPNDWPTPSTDPSVSITGSWSGNGDYTFTITGLTPNMHYRCRAYVYISSGTPTGELLSDSILLISTSSLCVPTVTTSFNTSTSTSVSVIGNITSTGGASATERGICWKVNSSGDPTTANSKVVDYGTFGTGAFTKNVTGLSSNTTYQFRAYAINAAGTGYGSTITITTAGTAPTVTTDSIVAGSISVDAFGSITNTGGVNATEEGFCWKTNTAGDPTTADSKDAFYGGWGTGPFSKTLTGLTQNTTYKFRAYAINTLGTGYGATIIATTTSDYPKVTTGSTGARTSTSFEINGTVNTIGDSNIKRRGFCYKVYDGTDPVLGQAGVLDNGTDGSWSAEPQTIPTTTISSLSPFTNYSIRAYGTNTNNKTGYGATLTVKTLAALPTLTISLPTGITETTCTANGAITNIGGELCSQRGFCWVASTTEIPDQFDSIITQTAGSYNTGSFSIPITGLLSGTHYRMRAFAVNSSGINYSSVIDFNTAVPEIPPIVETGNLTADVHSIGANGNITSLGTQNATGGTITYSGNYVIHTFTGDGNFVAPANMTVEYLIVGGGGAGGIFGGGGGGGFLTGTTGVSAGSHAVIVGAGGPHPLTDTTTLPSSGNGGNSSFNGIIAYGGGGGGNSDTNGQIYVNGANGGSGGGGGANLYPDHTADYGGSGVAGQGNKGGDTTGDHGSPSGGGGGAGAPGNLGGGTDALQMKGGDGLSSSISGTAKWYSGGGGGGSYDYNQVWYSTRPGYGAGGKGGGGRGGIYYQSILTCVGGTANTGGGGGGGAASFSPLILGSDGGSGIVIIRYLNLECKINRRGFLYRIHGSASPETDIGTDGLWDTVPQPFSGTITGLAAYTEYDIRAYARNTLGFTGYGAVRTIRTLAGLSPTVVTYDATSITNTQFMAVGNITSIGDTNATTRGFCYIVDSTAVPTISDLIVSETGTFGTGTYSLAIPIFAEKYRVRAYAINAGGISYGNTVDILNIPRLTEITTNSLEDTHRSIKAYGQITRTYPQGGVPFCPAISRRGFCYITSNSGTPTISDNVVYENGEFYEEQYNLTIPNLIEEVTYRVRAYAIRGSYEPYYGETISITLSPYIVVDTKSITNIQMRSFEATGEITSCYGTATKRGFCITTENRDPTINDRTFYNDGSFTVGEYTLQLTSLEKGTPYKVRAFAQNNVRTYYGDTLSTSTLPQYLAEMETYLSTNIEDTSFLANGAIINTGGDNCTERGFVYMEGDSGEPTLSNKAVKENGSFVAEDYSLPITSLRYFTKYRVRAYSINEAGISYGNTVTVETYYSIPVVDTIDTTSVDDYTIIATGSLVDLGGIDSTSVGFVYLIGTSGIPTLENCTGYIENHGSFGLGEFTDEITGLLSGQEYRIRSFAINDAGIGYGDTIDVTTRGCAFFTFTAPPGVIIRVKNTTIIGSHAEGGAKFYTLYDDGNINGGCNEGWIWKLPYIPNIIIQL